jgi:hypothetical protein
MGSTGFTPQNSHSTLSSFRGLDHFSPSFIKDVTLIVMQDWRAHRKVPRKPYTQIWHFTETRGSSFELIHETICGDVGTFLWRGQSDIHR